MKANYVIFGVIGCFLAIVGVVYTWMSYSFDPSGIEWVGAPALFALAAMCWMIAVYVWMNERRHGRGAMDNDDAEVHDEAGIQGTYAPYSWSPIWVAIGASIAFGGFPVAWPWVAIGIAIAMAGVIQWVFEFSRGTHSH